MAKFKEKIKAQDIRRQGESIKKIAKKLSVSKSTVSLWCTDIILTNEQIKNLKDRIKNGNYAGGLKGAKIQHEKRVGQISVLRKEGLSMIDNFSNRDLLFAGAGLYWGEGTKKREVRFINSNPEVVKFIIRWFKDIWGIKEDGFRFQILINLIHKNRIGTVEKYWRDTLGINREQFTKTILIKRKNKKIYKNFSEHYGTISVRIKRGGDLLHKILGLISGLSIQY